VRPEGFGAEAAAVGFVVGVVALEPFDLAVAFEGEDVGRDAVAHQKTFGTPACSRTPFAVWRLAMPTGPETAAR
jgi:hypothetical protein